MTRRVLLALILAGAAALRFWALDSGLPNVAARPDEHEALRATAGFAAGDLNPRWFVYPNLFFYLTWLWAEGVLGVRRLWVDTPAYGALLATRPEVLILYGRTLSALAGTATVALVYAAGRRLGGSTVGLVAAAVLAGNWLHVRDSHALKTEALLAAGILVSLWQLARYLEQPTARRAAVAGVATGLASGLKYPGLLLIGPAYVATLLASRRPGWRRMVPGRDLAIISGAALASFLATSPFLLLDLTRATDTASLISFAVYASRPQHLAPADAGWLAATAAWLQSRAFGYHLTVSLRHGSGLLVALALPVGLLRALRQPARPLGFLAAGFCILFYLVAGASPVHLARYQTPLTPLIALLVADLAVAGASRVRNPAARTALVTGLTLALVAEPVTNAVAANRIAARTDTRVAATAWMARHLPAGAVVAQLGTFVFPIADPPLPPGVRRAPVSLGETRLERHGVTHVTTHEHHQLPFSHLDATQMTALAGRLGLLAEFSPFRAGPAGWFEREDAYYVPFARFAGVVRPGPLVRIYAYEAAAP